MVEILTEEKDTKTGIIGFLSNSWPASTKQIYQHIKQSLPISYQAVHKAIRCLCEKKVLLGDKALYSINPQWITQMNSLVEVLSSSYLKDPMILEQKLRNEDVVMLRFKRTIDVEKFIIHTFLKLPIKERLPSVCQWKRMRCIIGLSEADLAIIQQSALETPYYIACQSATNFDKALEKYYKRWGGKIKSNVETITDCDTFVRGEWIAQIYTSERYNQVWKSFYMRSKNLQDINFDQILKLMHHMQFDIRVLILRSKSYADAIRQKIIRMMKK